MSLKRQKRVRMPSATSVVARSYPDHIIGIDNELPWKLRTDLKNFKKVTSHHVVVMGRKTYESIGRPLPNRVSIVLSKEPVEDTTNVKWASDPSTALYLADVFSIMMANREFFVIGGEKIYSLFDHLINKVILTEVFTNNINGDAKFDYEFRENPEWYPKSEEDFPATEFDEYPFRVTIYRRFVDRHRYRLKEEFIGSRRDPDFDKYLEQYNMLLESPKNRVGGEQLYFDI